MMFASSVAKSRIEQNAAAPKLPAGAGRLEIGQLSLPLAALSARRPRALRLTAYATLESDCADAVVNRR
jgi:hypothetical protein